MEKKEIDLKGKELEEMKEVIAEEINKLYTDYKLEVVNLGNIDWLPTILSFSLGAITSGILKEIGKEIWTKIKETFIKSKKQTEIPNFEFEFEHKGLGIIAEIKGEDPAELRSAFNRLSEVYEKIEDLKSENKKISELRMVLDLDKGYWESKE
jgi:hypothetical protein